MHEIGETWSIGRSFVHTGRRIQHTHGHYFHRNWHWPARWSLKATNQPVVDKRRCSISFWPCGAHIYIYMVVAIGDVDRNGWRSPHNPRAQSQEPLKFIGTSRLRIVECLMRWKQCRSCTLHGIANANKIWYWPHWSCLFCIVRVRARRRGGR